MGNKNIVPANSKATFPPIFYFVLSRSFFGNPERQNQQTITENNFRSVGFEKPIPKNYQIVLQFLITFWPFTNILKPLLFNEISGPFFSCSSALVL